MATTITDVELFTPKHCFKNKDIGPNNLEVDFTVTVGDDGCYAIAVVVLDEDDFSSDDVVASNLANGKLRCICLKAGQSKKFAISAGGNGPKPTPEPGRIQLDNLTGTWPTDDGPLDDTLGLYVTIDVYRCSLEKKCKEGADCNKFLNTGRIEDFTPLGSFTSRDRPQETEIVDGEGADRAIELIEKGASAAGSIPGLAKSEVTSSSDVFTTVMLRQNKRIDKRLGVLAQRIGTLERLSAETRRE